MTCIMCTVICCLFMISHVYSVVEKSWDEICKTVNGGGMLPELLQKLLSPAYLTNLNIHKDLLTTTVNIFMGFYTPTFTYITYSYIIHYLIIIIHTFIHIQFCIINKAASDSHEIAHLILHNTYVYYITQRCCHEMPEMYGCCKRTKL